jgi:hypothetical protein
MAGSPKDNEEKLTRILNAWKTLVLRAGKRDENRRPDPVSSFKQCAVMICYVESI